MTYPFKEIKMPKYFIWIIWLCFFNVQSYENKKQRKKNDDFLIKNCALISKILIHVYKIYIYDS